MPFTDFDELEQPLTLPWRGHEYVLPRVGILDGARLTLALDPDSDDTLTDSEFRGILLGDVYQQMIDDDAPAALVARALATALAEFQAGRAVAEAAWETGGDPKALRLFMDSRPSTGTDEATTTP